MKTLDSWQSNFRWTAKAVADLHAAIRVAGFEGKPLLQANVPEVAALFRKSPSGKGCNEQGGARVLPAFVLIPVPFSPSLFISLSGRLGCSAPLQLTLHTLSLHLVIALLSLSLPFAPVQLWRTR